MLCQPLFIYKQKVIEVMLIKFDSITNENKFSLAGVQIKFSFKKHLYRIKRNKMLEFTSFHGIILQKMLTVILSFTRS